MTMTSPAQEAAGEERAIGLAQEAYVSEEWYRRELDRFLLRRWHYVGHVSELAKPGDFIRFDFADYSVLVTRDRAGEIHAMHNVCRHRGSRLTDAEGGNCKRAFVCQYHGWSYGHDGSLLGAPRMQPSFDKSQFPLKGVQVDVWSGLVFINLGLEAAAPVSELLGFADVSAYRIDNTRVAWDVKKVIQCNWKVLWENGLECYHCAINHPEVSKVVRVERDAPIAKEIPVSDFDWTDNYPLVHKSLTTDGEYGVRKFLGDDSTTPQPNASYLSWHTGTLEVVILPDYVKITSYKPLSATTTESRVIGLVHTDAVEGEDYDLAKLREVTIATRAQDDELVELIQRGLNSPAYEPGPFNDTYERTNENFTKLYRSMLGV